ncbi:chromosome segregation protein SMC [Methanocalculus chunghsingensis]|uniref:Chromosome segregation protein SMC n=1 Tax=Methanocalculus chunghsingensis TaxID=156457 RepID=A0A8J7W550_9EURY|nr:AAA family ATPase [Methanocalculus chunghsingensis]MBR1368479.1 chromosome segregation protein SMC [Methanocalculus chunghsingensis]
MRKLDTIHISGFKSIKNLDVTLHDLNVMIGANGAGKTNFISIFRLLNEMVEGRLQFAVAKAGGVRSLLHYGPKTTKKIEVNLRFGKNGYSCIWDSAGDEGLIFQREETEFYGHGPDATPYYDLVETGHRETKLNNYAKLPGHQVSRFVLESLKSWRVYHFHDTSNESPIKAIEQINDNMYFRYNASNLAPFLYYLQKIHEKNYNDIRDMVRLAAPFFDDFILRPLPENNDLIKLEWKEKNSDYPFLAHHLSDGTLRFICLATLLLQPDLPELILIDEPELGLHPYALNIVADLIMSASKRSQIILSTQSVSLINQFEPEDILVVDRHDGETTIKRLVPEDLEDWLSDYSLGELWEMNILGGKPQR